MAIINTVGHTDCVHTQAKIVDPNLTDTKKMLPFSIGWVVITKIVKRQQRTTDGVG